MQWEYRTLTLFTSPGNLEKAGLAALNELGKDGWEAVGITHAADAPDGQPIFEVLLKRLF